MILHDGTLDFDTIDRPRAADLPAVSWKLINLEKLKNENADKHAQQRHELEGLLGSGEQIGILKQTRQLAPAAMCFTICNYYSRRKKPWP